MRGRDVRAAQRRLDGHVSVSRAEVADVRRPPEQDVIRHLHVGGQHGLLRHEGDDPGEPSPAQARRRLPVELHDALVSDEPADGAKQRRLPGAVRADEPHPGAGLDLLTGVDRERPRSRSGPSHHESRSSDAALCPARPEDEQEERSTDEGRDHADRNLSR